MGGQWSQGRGCYLEISSAWVGPSWWALSTSGCSSLWLSSLKPRNNKRASHHHKLDNNTPRLLKAMLKRLAARPDLPEVVPGGVQHGGKQRPRGRCVLRRQLSIMHGRCSRSASCCVLRAKNARAAVGFLPARPPPAAALRTGTRLPAGAQCLARGVSG